LLEGGTLDIANASATGTLSVASGATVDASGLVIGASGVVTLQGGVLSVSGIVSQNSGNITGFGTIAGALTNTGTMLTQSGTLDVTGAIGGAGAITIAGGTALEVDGVLGDSQSVTFDTSVAAGNLVLGSLQASNGFALQNWQNGDELIINNGATITGSNWLGGGTLAVFTSAGTYDFTNVTLAAGTSPVFNTGANFVELVSCFAEGTLIRTANGDVPVEQLAVGDMLPTALDGRMRPIVWIGHRTVRCDTHPKPEQVLPVRIRAGAFGPGLPQWDLVLSPEHAVYVDGVLIPVRKLVNGTTVAFQQVTRVTYYHVELPRHDVLYAEGMPAESYLDLGDRDMYFNGKVVRLHTVSIRHHDTDLAAVWESMGCAPLVQSGPLLAAVRQRLELSELVHEERLRA
ncbi:MAG TPA: Hint domain-containing protein, partial [Acetobacteraceae bacterium]|nr:Hint domain-containing protein [Acetobacteraceae bacterium]